ncbi:cysteine hydrolase family protein [Paraburkholderia kirstenboschensis]|uniref:Isochorismatase family protein n=1 Tax=Paraburkholderia kirstenboschensis TaxID=1245436 RepID=A0ABZ0EDV9_9BURK|nr:isochorismatase family protein [Paraburkholderia kirstenboschensis]WOD14392.1 isochorismatase family protein [Paraburkholderia kirstenboschensis]
MPIRAVASRHRRWEPCDYEGWDHPAPSQRLVMDGHHFALGQWGGDWHPDLMPKDGDVVVAKHWGSSGFANTDLDVRLKQNGITHVIIAGLLANSLADLDWNYCG